MRTTNHTTVLGLSAVLAVSSVAPAQVAAQAAPPPVPVDAGLTQYVTADKAQGTPDSKEGFAGSLTLGASFNLAHNRYVVGQVEGLAVLLGISGVAAGSYRKGKHEWKGTLNLAETWARTAVIEEFVKSNDVLALDNIYNYYLAPWTGPFAKLDMFTSILPTERVTAEDQTYTPEDGTGPTPTTDHFKLGDSFQPFTINESLGWFAQPVNSEPITLYGRAGFGARHTFADGARIVTADTDPAAIVYKDLSDVHQAGVELFAGLDGKAQEGRLQYALGVSALFPMYNNDDLDRSTAELTRVMAQGSLGVGIFDWMSLNYLIKVARDYQMIEEIQVQNSLLVTVSYSASTPAPEAPPVDPAIAAAEQRAAAAEARADAAEARAAAAEAAIQAEPPAPSPIAPSAPSAEPSAVDPAAAPQP